MSIVRSSIINEEFVGYMTGYDGEVTVIKNPTTLKTLHKSCRGVSDSKGNMFICNDSNIEYGIIHLNIINFMIAEGYLHGTSDDYESEYGWDGIVCWQRDRDKNVMYLSESYSIRDMEMGERDDIRKLSSLINKKNPNMDYELILTNILTGDSVDEEFDIENEW